MVPGLRAVVRIFGHLLGVGIRLILPGEPRRYVQDLMRERAPDLAVLLKDPQTYLYVCGLKSMEEGVVLALRDVAMRARLRRFLGQGLCRRAQSRVPPPKTAQPVGLPASSGSARPSRSRRYSEYVADPREPTSGTIAATSGAL